ncbi:uncharacterized protein LOC135392028 [Ornithodoros turicata]|uniref:uncharacterized protein LOC135392028 n=1 Tax=Ornithodoros turicata TaxID=34597 RepID=UPI0031398023
MERFHRTLKAALMCHGNAAEWVCALPILLLDIRTTLDSELTCSVAELVFGTTLRLPSEFFVSRIQDVHEARSSYLAGLQQAFQHPCPPPCCGRHSHRPYVSSHLTISSHVLLRTDAVRKSLPPPYSGPHPVLSLYLAHRRPLSSRLTEERRSSPTTD